MPSKLDQSLPLSDTWRPRFNPWLIAITVTLATFMEVLDTSIANVALPHISGALSAGQDDERLVQLADGAQAVLHDVCGVVYD